MSELNDLINSVPVKYLKKLNAQDNQVKLQGKVDVNGVILQPYRFVVGLGERHFKEFEKQIETISALYPWIRKKHVRFVMNELVLNTQFSMLREVVKKTTRAEKVPGYFFVTIFVNEKFFSAGIDEFGDYFDYFQYLEENQYFDENKFDGSRYYDRVSEEKFTGLDRLSSNKLKLILTQDSKLKMADDSNRIGLNVIENVTDHDFYVSSFYKDGKYMWKRISFRIENDE